MRSSRSYSTIFAITLWNSLCMGLIGLGVVFGLVGGLFTHDASHLTTVMAALMGVVVLYSFWAATGLDLMSAPQPPSELWSVVAFPTFLKGEVFVLLGLAGTLIGISMMASQMGVSSGDVTSDLLTVKINLATAAMQTAFNASLVGIVCKLWTEIIVYILGVRVAALEPAA